MSAATLAMKSSRLATTYPGRNTAASAAASRFALLNVRPASHAALRRLVNEREPKHLFFGFRDLLKVVNHLYGTTFEEASEFAGAKKGSQSLVEFAEKTFDADDGKTKMLKEAAPPIEELISICSAVEHPDGYSGKLVVANFTLGADRRVDEPTWHRENDGKAAGSPHPFGPIWKPRFTICSHSVRMFSCRGPRIIFRFRT